jgi:hypothetical protein
MCKLGEIIMNETIKDVTHVVKNTLKHTPKTKACKKQGNLMELCEIIIILCSERNHTVVKSCCKNKK